MTLISYQLSRRILLVLFALLVFSFLGFQPQPQPIAASDEPSLPGHTGAPAPSHPSSRSNLFPGYPKNTTQLPGIRVKLNKQQSNAAKVLSNLAKLGPVFPAAFSTSDFRMEGFVKGNWPIVIVYHLEADSAAEAIISTNDGKLKFPILLPPTNGERTEVMKQLPEGFGQKPQVGSISFRALKNGPKPQSPADFFLYGLGVGDKAVGSLVIVNMQVRPSSIRPKLKEKTSYSFQALSDFNKVTAEFSVMVSAKGGSHMTRVYLKEFKNGVRRGEVVTDNWDGKNSKGKISVGHHVFQVRAWRDLEKGADYTYTASRNLAIVEKE